MAIVRLAQPFDAFHGTVAGPTEGSKVTIWSSRKVHAASRTWVTPTNPQSTNQMLMRGYQIAATAAYSALTAAQAALWVAAAEQIHRENILGLSYELSGINLFCMINNYRQIDGQAILSDCPEILRPAMAVSVDTVSKPNPTTLAFIARFPSAVSGELAFARVSAPLPSAVRQARKNDVRITGTFAQSIVSQSSGSATFLLTVGSTEFVVGDFIGIEITPLSAAYFPGTKLLIGNIEIE